MATLKDLRERVLLSQSELGLACGVGKQAVWQWESGRTSPSAVHRRKLVEVLECTREELLAALKETKAARERRIQEEEQEQPAA